MLLNPAEVDSNVYASTKINTTASGYLKNIQFASQAEEQQFLGQIATVGNTIDDAIAQPQESVQTEDNLIQQVDLETLKGTLEEPQSRMMEASKIAAEPARAKLEVSYYTVTDEAFLSSKLDLQNKTTFHVSSHTSKL